MRKSKLVLFGNVVGAFDLAAVLGCKVSSLPMTYLGLPLGSSFKVCVVWSSIIEKIERSLVGLEEIVFVKGRKTYSYQKHIIQLINLFSFFAHCAYLCS